MCYHCKKPGHLIADYLAMKTSLHVKEALQVECNESAMKAIWDDSEIESEKEVYTTNMCFMAQGNISSEVQTELTLDDAEITFDEMAMAFQEPMEKYESLGIKHFKLKKENNVLSSKLEIAL